MKPGWASSLFQKLLMSPALGGRSHDSFVPMVDPLWPAAGCVAAVCHRLAEVRPTADDDGLDRITFAPALQSCALLGAPEF
jgi:hypothetical protein